MSIRLSAVGVSEVKPADESASVPFDLAGDDEAPFDGGLPIVANAASLPATAMPAVGPGLLDALRQWAEMQRRSFELLEKAFATVPAGFSIATSTSVKTTAFPQELLSKPWDNIQIGDVKFGMPPGCVKLLTDAGLVSVAGLANCINANELTKLPRVGKAKAAVIAETFRAFERAVKAHQERVDHAGSDDTL
jgi:hypothetical protein